MLSIPDTLNYREALLWNSIVSFPFGTMLAPFMLVTSVVKQYSISLALQLSVFVRTPTPFLINSHPDISVPWGSCMLSSCPRHLLLQRSPSYLHSIFLMQPLPQLTDSCKTISCLVLFTQLCLMKGMSLSFSSLV